MHEATVFLQDFDAIAGKEFPHVLGRITDAVPFAACFPEDKKNRETHTPQRHRIREIPGDRTAIHSQLGITISGPDVSTMHIGRWAAPP